MNVVEHLLGGRSGAWKKAGWMAVLGLCFGVATATSCGTPTRCQHTQCRAPFVCDKTHDVCVCKNGENGATCESNEDCETGFRCNQSKCNCVQVFPWDEGYDTSSSTHDPSDPTNDPSNTTSDPTSDPSTSGSETSGTTGGMNAYVYVLVRDNTEIDEEDDDDHGCNVDSVQLYDQNDDHYPIGTVCGFGAASDPDHSDCSEAIGMKMIGSCGPEDTHYVSLGGVGGWLIATMPVEMKEGDVVTPIECSGRAHVTFSAFVGFEPEVDSPFWVPLELSPNNALIVPPLPPPP